MREGEPRGTVHCRVATIQATTEIGEGLGGFGCKHRSRGQLVREGETALAIDRCRPKGVGRGLQTAFPLPDVLDRRGDSRPLVQQRGIPAQLLFACLTSANHPMPALGVYFYNELCIVR